jgi:NTE family protein
MDAGPISKSREPHAPWRPDGFANVALVLQGGGALGAYQAGAYEAMHERGLEPDWVAGVSIGGINGAIIAGNPRERRLERLRAFWDTVTARPIPLMLIEGDAPRRFRNAWSAWLSLKNEVVQRWTGAIAQSDGFVFVTPEYNYGPSI